MVDATHTLTAGVKWGSLFVLLDGTMVMMVVVEVVVVVMVVTV